MRAKAVYGDVMAGQEELDAAKAELESAQNAYLKKVTGCKETLTEEIKVSEKIDLSKYTSESATKYQEALKRAKEMLDRADAQPEELDAKKERTGRGKKSSDGKSRTAKTRSNADTKSKSGTGYCQNGTEKGNGIYRRKRNQL